ncbi:MAG TPA: hypothetical protein VFW38_05275 [Solirubrobacteraceae bacterium]|nr:hypothetical protein [Solirubrobacteraceae bacterium]
MKNTTSRIAVALAATALAAAALSACSGAGGGESPQALLSDTFSSHSQIESGKIDLAFSLAASGSHASTQPMSVHLSGPFQSEGAGKLPHFSLALQASVGGHTLGAGATATGSALYVQIAGAWFSTPSSTYKAIEEGFAHASSKASTSKVQSTFSSLGIDPGKWLAEPSDAGTATVDGVETVHLTAAVDVPAFLADVSKLSQAGSALGLASPLSGGGSISAGAIDELAKSIHSARVDVYTGKSDHTLRRLEVDATVVATTQTQALLGGLHSARLRLLLEFSRLNQPQSISAPANPQSPSQLLPALQQLLGGLEGTTSAQGGSTLEPLS